MVMPTKYDPETTPEQAYKLCLLGAINKDLGDFFGVTERAFERWMRNHPELKDAVHRGRAVADAEIAHALYNRAKGYKHKDYKFFQYEGEILAQGYTKHYPPDTAAAQWWLMNRDPSRWRSKQQVEHSGPDGGPIEIARIERVIIDPASGDEDE